MYTGGLNEEEQVERALRNSLNDRGKESHFLLRTYAEPHKFVFSFFPVVLEV